MTPSFLPSCPRCGRARLADEPADLCPACAWRELAESEVASEPVDASVLFSVSGHDVVEEIARGGSAVVYRARQREPRRDVALKMLLPQQLGSPEMRARFRLEADTIAALDHPGILPLYLAGEHDGLPFFTMKLATGGTLAARRGSLQGRWREIAALVADVADAVQFAHARGVIHRDLKPANILFDESGGAYVSDFGLAKLIAGGGDALHTATVLGTPAYLAPEVAEAGAAHATIASDTYGLGAILYELLTGRPPFQEASLTALLKRVAEAVPASPEHIVADTPRDLAVVAMCCLEKIPARRYATAGELAEELRSWLSGRPIRARPVGAGERLLRWARRNPALATLSGLLTLTLLGGGAALTASNRELRTALGQAQSAESKAQQSLHTSLLSEARLWRQSRRVGRRTEAVGLVERAARIAPTLAVRNELVAALAQPDLWLVRRLPAFFPGEAFVTDYSPDLETYLTPRNGGGLELRRVADGAVARAYVLPEKTAAARAVFAGQGRFFSVVLTDLRTGFWAVERPEPHWVLPVAADGVTPKSALHPGEPVVAYRGPSEQVVLRDFISGTERVLTAPGERIYALAFDPTGRRLLVLRRDGAAMLSTDSGRVVWSVAERVLGANPAWSRDGRYVATGNFPRPDISIRDAETGRVRNVLAGHATYPDFMGFVPDGRRFVSMAFDRTLRIWDLPSEREVLIGALPMRALRIASDGRSLGAAADAQSLALYSAVPETVFRELVGVPGVGTTSTSIEVSRDGRWVLTSVRYQNDREWRIHVRLWDPEQGRERAAFEFPEGGRATVRFHPTDRAVVFGSLDSGVRSRRFVESADGAMRFLPEETRGDGARGVVLGFDATGRTWWVQRSNGGPIAQWTDGDPRTERAMASVDTGGGIAAEGAWAWGFGATELRAWRVAPGSGPTAAVVIPLAADSRVAFAADRDEVVVGDARQLRVLGMPGLNERMAWPNALGEEVAADLEFSPDGRYFATASRRHGIELRDARTFAELARLELPLEAEVSLLAWAPDASRLYLLARGPRVFVWDLGAIRAELAARNLDW